MQHRHGKKSYAALGKILIQKRPEIAQELLAYCQVTGETNLEKIPHFFKRFCEYLQIDPLQYTGKLYNQEKLKVRRLFVAAMLHIYNRHIFHLPHTSPIMRSGFVIKLSECQAVTMAGISQMIRQVMFDEKVYEEFRVSIETIVQILKPEPHLHGQA